jgi:hypothetical protein
LGVGIGGSGRVEFGGLGQGGNGPVTGAPKVVEQNLRFFWTEKPLFYGKFGFGAPKSGRNQREHVFQNSGFPGPLFFLVSDRFVRGVGQPAHVCRLSWG